ncbi:GNAT family N-acetyltransferase [Streptomyces marispadix]|uniref:GNAT family N-acetyltransferase n=1 Tax=Streptomyces marispadix TaxID=2922868 RepID=A0ABS9SWT4_9ACTN|nr:GNAT family N-acetyltransferase [Streptomyces marispadix]MCH6160728.1 GNAT family N-acetyltransferase [Streptomyces marispadix]
MFRIETQADEERRRLVRQRLRESNSRSSPVMAELRGTPSDSEVPVEVYAFDGDRLNGGLVGEAWGFWLHIRLLWVEESARGSGLGSRLMAAAEEHARDRLGCVNSRVETFDFQAPGFYRKLGYNHVGKIEDYPPGCTEHLFVKRL